MEGAEDGIKELEGKVDLTLRCEDGGCMSGYCVGANENEEIREFGDTCTIVRLRRMGVAVFPLRVGC